MKDEKEFTKPGVRNPTFIQFGSRLAPLTNAIMRIRYVESTSVKEVLAWLAQQNAGCSRQSYQKFVRRLLHHLSDAQALEMGVELPLLHAIRRRLQMPLKARKPWRMTYVRGPRSEP